MIRPIHPADAEPVLALAQATGLFTDDELPELRGMLDGALDGSLGPDHLWFVDDEGGDIAGLAYVAPEAFADRVWNLYLLAVDPTRQGGGRGAALVAHVEATVRARGARILLIETSGTAAFEATRGFYRKIGYLEEARLRGYYGPGDDVVMFTKALAEDA